MISCGEVRDRLSPYIDGRLPEQDRRLVQAHLESCNACRDEMEALIALDRDLREAHASGDPGSGHMEALADSFPRRFDLAGAKAGWQVPGASRRIAFLPPVPSRWMPALRLALTTAVLAGIVLAVREAGRLTTVPHEAKEQVTTPMALPDVAIQEERPPLEAITAFFAGILEEPDTGVPKTEAVRMRGAPEAATERLQSDPLHPAAAGPQLDADDTGQFAILEEREADPGLPDTLWTRMWRATARSLAHQAMETSLREDCIRALRAYWMMSHRAGRSLQSGIEEQNRLYEPEQSRLRYLMECTGGQAEPEG